MPGEGKQGNGMTFGREAVMPEEGKQGNGMTLGGRRSCRERKNRELA